MGKRSSFERVPRDFYRTPYKPVIPLLPHLDPATRYSEPCAGDGALVDHLNRHGHICVWASDIQPQSPSVTRADAFEVMAADEDCFITNCPWDRKILHGLIEHLGRQLPTWLLFDAAWAYTGQSAELIKSCDKIVAVGRVRWIPGTKYDGKDDAAWYRFMPNHRSGPRFYGRVMGQ